VDMETQPWISLYLYTWPVGERYSDATGSTDLSTIHRAYYYF